MGSRQITHKTTNCNTFEDITKYISTNCETHYKDLDCTQNNVSLNYKSKLPSKR